MELEFLKIIKFEVNGRLFAFPSNCVKEIIDSLDSVIEVSYGGKVLRGVMNFDGNLISVIDLPLLLDIPEVDRVSMMLACKNKEMDTPVALLITGIKGIEITGLSSIQTPQDEDADYIQGFLDDEEGVALLNLKKLLDYAGTKIENINQIFDVSDYNEMTGEKK